jgi:branched-chain amino acid transport system permease protein
VSPVIEVMLNGVVLGGMYTLVALGLNLQYGIARIMNLSYGEVLMAAAFGTFFTVTLYGANPFLTLAVTMPVAFAMNWLVYQLFFRPLIKQRGARGSFESDTILVTFGLLFVVQNAALITWGADYRGYTFMADAVEIFGTRYAANRLVALVAACVIGLGAYAFLRYSRTGMALRAIAVDPTAAQLVAIDVRRYSGFAFAAGGALAAAAGSLVSMFLTFNPSVGVVFTMKALIVVILGGVGNMMGCLAAGIILGMAESLGGYLVDPGLTLAINYGIFVVVLLARPTGLFATR